MLARSSNISGRHGAHELGVRGNVVDVRVFMCMHLSSHSIPF